MSTDNTVPFKKSEPMIVPFTKGNEEKREPIPHHIIFTIGPMVHESAMSAAAQALDQGWKVLAVVFVGQTQASRIVRSGPQQIVALYLVSICKVFSEGNEIIKPYLMLPETPAPQ